MNNINGLRIGQGFDLHCLVPNRPLIIGGVNIPHDMGLLGHSDADVLLHALIDALIGAFGLGDIGVFFPDNDVQYNNIDSRVLLRKIHTILIKNRQFYINNIDATIIAESPKMRDYIMMMQDNIAHDLMINNTQINIKAKTSEGVGIVGNKFAIVAQVVILLQIL